MRYFKLHKYEYPLGVQQVTLTETTASDPAGVSFNVVSVDDLEIVAGSIQLKTQATLDAEANAALRPAAQTELEHTDLVALRCFKANVAFPADWQAHAVACRNIVNGTDTTSTILPGRPTTYPAGT